MVVFSGRRVFRRGGEVGCSEVGGGEVGCSEVGGGEVGCDEVGDGGESVLRDERGLATSKSIGSKSYNTLMRELVALETQYMASVSEKNPEEDCVDDVASTIESSKVPVTGEAVERKGDLLEEIELYSKL
ncbi:hypothetical protein Tco_1190433 [Tanacetum coccineum]